MFRYDNDLYDRQIRTLGEDANKKILSSSVVIIGLENGLATEIGKNLCLLGVSEIFLFDNEHIQQSNLETGFYYSESNIGKIRSNVLSEKIKELNPYVNVVPIFSEEEITTYSILMIVNQSPEKVIYYEKKFFNKMVCVFSTGIAGMIFSCAGKNHTITDTMGENIEAVQIGSIDTLGKVLCAQNNKHDFQSGDYIKFENVEGLNVSKLLDKEFKINVISPTCFTITNEFDFSEIKLSNGTAIIIKKSISITHQPFSVQVDKPTFNLSFDDSEIIFNTLLKYFKSINSFKTENPWSLEYSETLNKTFGENANLARTFGCEFLPVFSVIGSVAAFEAIKLITGKFMPINQFWCWYDPNLITINKPLTIGLTSIGKIYGSDIESKLANSSWFIPGSGAIGCELLKNLAFLGVATNKGTIYLTDPDNIEKSNLNRQFLFRSHHIGKPKSLMAVESIRLMKPSFNIVGLTQKVCKDTQSFVDKYTACVTGVINALDNIEARRYMDQECFNKQMPLFESGTTGTKGNTQVVIPYLTETYSNSADPPQEKSFPICTIKSFPNEITHTIHWAMDYFEIFNRGPKNINKWIKDSSVFDNGVSVENNQGKEDVFNFLIKFNIKSFTDCVHRAIIMFYEKYKHQIEQLLTTYPENYKIEDSNFFWSNGKRKPKPFDKFDCNNSYHLDYIEATSRLIAQVYQLDEQVERDEIKSIAKNLDKDLDTFNKNVDIVLPDNSSFKNIVLKPEEFDKDNIIHVNFITASSNLRAINYSIPPITFQETKGIAGRIIPAIATTTSVVSGLIVLEILKYIINSNEDKIEKYRSSYINLADTSLVYSEPIAAGTTLVGGQEINIWTKFEFTHDTTIQKFKEYYENMFKTEMSMITYGTTILFSNLDFINCDIDITKNLSEIIKQINIDVDFNEISVITIISSNDELELPEIHFKINKN
jgi:ubiquitin-activating enzyme E1